MSFLEFEPVPLRSQHNGWSPRRQLRFIVALARGAGPGEAACSLGMTRQSAYRLRKKPGAESFAAAWDGAQAFARTAACAGRSLASSFGGVETILVPRHYRGRLIGFVQREDVAGAMRLLGQLDRLADRLGDVPDVLATDEALEAFERLTGSRSDRGDTTPLADVSLSSLLAELGATLDEPGIGPSPYTRTREGVT